MSAPFDPRRCYVEDGIVCADVCGRQLWLADENTCPNAPEDVSDFMEVAGGRPKLCGVSAAWLHTDTPTRPLSKNEAMNALVDAALKTEPFTQEWDARIAMIGPASLRETVRARMIMEALECEKC